MRGCFVGKGPPVSRRLLKVRYGTSVGMKGNGGGIREPWLIEAMVKRNKEAQVSSRQLRSRQSLKK